MFSLMFNIALQTSRPGHLAHEAKATSITAGGRHCTQDRQFLWSILSGEQLFQQGTVFRRLPRQTQMLTGN